MDRLDKALLAAYLVAAGLGTWQRCLMVNDGAVFIAAAWLGDAWNLFFDQNIGRAVSTLFQFGLAWAIRPLFGNSADAFSSVAHALYFAGPLVLWLALRTVEAQRVYSRLYLCITLAMIYFTSEMVAGIGLWMIWLALLADETRSRRAGVVATVVLAPAIAFTHPAVALLSLLFGLVGAALFLAGRPFPKRLVIAAAAMGLFLIGAYLAVSAFPPSNPTIAFQQALNRYDYVNPLWMLATLWLFPMLVALWLLLWVPGLESADLRWRLSPLAVLPVGTAGLCLAAGGTGLLTWLYARHTASHVLAVALALALVAPPTWLSSARRPLMLYAAISAVAALSYNADLFLFGRFVDRQMRQGVTDVDTPAVSWPPPLAGAYGIRSYFKWAAGPDYQRDVVVPIYDWYRVTLAFYSFFRSDREGILFHRLEHRGDWIPFECTKLDPVRARQHDGADETFLAFLSQNYCVR